MGTAGAFGALAAVKISANTAWFARDLPLYINPNDTRRNPTAINLYGHVTEREIVPGRVCVDLNSRVCPCGEHLLPTTHTKKVVRRHTRQLHVGDRCSHR